MTEQAATPIEIKINALFEKAEAQYKVGTEEAVTEADIYIAKAHKLIATYSLNEELLRQRAKQAGKTFSQPVEKHYDLPEGPYIKFRSSLASRIALAMGMRTMVANDGSFVEIIGFEDDCDMAWRIFHLIAPQMLVSADLRLKRGEHKGVRDSSARSGFMSGKTWKANYFNTYINRIAGRIEVSRMEAAEEVVFAEGYEDESGKIVGRATGALVLVDRKTAVEKFFEEKHPVKKYKNGKEKKINYWKAPAPRSTSVDAQRAGREDGAKARITESAELAKARGRLTV